MRRRRITRQNALRIPARRAREAAPSAGVPPTIQPRISPAALDTRNPLSKPLVQGGEHRFHDPPQPYSRREKRPERNPAGRAQDAHPLPLTKDVGRERRDRRDFNRNRQRWQSSATRRPRPPVSRRQD